MTKHRVESPVASTGAGPLLLLPAGGWVASAAAVLAGRAAPEADFCRFAGGCSRSDAWDGLDDSWLP